MGSFLTFRTATCEGSGQLDRVEFLYTVLRDSIVPPYPDTALLRVVHASVSSRANLPPRSVAGHFAMYFKHSFLSHNPTLTLGDLRAPRTKDIVTKELKLALACIPDRAITRRVTLSDTVSPVYTEWVRDVVSCIVGVAPAWRCACEVVDRCASLHTGPTSATPVEFPAAASLDWADSWLGVALAPCDTNIGDAIDRALARPDSSAGSVAALETAQRAASSAFVQFLLDAFDAVCGVAARVQVSRAPVIGAVLESASKIRATASASVKFAAGDLDILVKAHRALSLVGAPTGARGGADAALGLDVAAGLVKATAESAAYLARATTSDPVAQRDEVYRAVVLAVTDAEDAFVAAASSEAATERRAAIARAAVEEVDLAIGVVARACGRLFATAMQIQTSTSAVLDNLVDTAPACVPRNPSLTPSHTRLLEIAGSKPSGSVGTIPMRSLLDALLCVYSCQAPLD